MEGSEERRMRIEKKSEVGKVSKRTMSSSWMLHPERLHQLYTVQGPSYHKPFITGMYMYCRVLELLLEQLHGLPIS